MTEAEARAIIRNPAGHEAFWPYIQWNANRVVTIDGTCNADLLEAIAWWLRHMPEDATP